MTTATHPTLRPRRVDAQALEALQAQGVEAWLAKIIAARPYPQKHAKGVAAILSARLADLDSPLLMKDMDKAIARIAQALAQGEMIALETDHDCDGQTAQAVMLTALTEILGVPKTRIQSYIGHRLKEGYGLSDSVVERILNSNPRPSLVITADNGSSDEPRIARLKAAGIDVIVTDHHELPAEGPPPSAYACLNPTRSDCGFPDPWIAGCMVAWLLMAGVRQHLIQAGQLPSTTRSMAELLDFVAVGTVADCVSMAQSVNNRAVVRYGLQLIRQAKRPCWQAILPLLRSPEVSAQDLGFVVAPLLNSDGRLSDALGSVSFLLSESLAIAGPWAQELWARNQERKGIQKTLTRQAMEQAAEQVEAGRASIVVSLTDGHAGVHGISASRVKDAFGRPTILFSPKLNEPTQLTGSARSIDAVHMRKALQWVAEHTQGVVLKFGGHRGAAGVLIVKDQLEAFAQAFEEAVLQQVAPEAVGPVIWTDGALPLGLFQLSAVDRLRDLEPIGREFEAPIFETDATIERLRRVGQDLTHAQLVLRLSNRQTVNAIWFNCVDDSTDVLRHHEGEDVHVTFSLGDNLYRDQRSLQLQVLDVRGLES